MATESPSPLSSQPSAVGGQPSVGSDQPSAIGGRSSAVGLGPPRLDRRAGLGRAGAIGRRAVHCPVAGRPAYGRSLERDHHRREHGGPGNGDGAGSGLDRLCPPARPGVASVSTGRMVAGGLPGRLGPGGCRRPGAHFVRPARPGYLSHLPRGGPGFAGGRHTGLDRTRGGPGSDPAPGSPARWSWVPWGRRASPSCWNWS